MKTKRHRFIALNITATSLLCNMAQAQHSPTVEANNLALYQSSPIGKDMLDDPKANFFEIHYCTRDLNLPLINNN
jgi:hypothetical protein